MIASKAVMGHCAVLKLNKLINKARKYTKKKRKSKVCCYRFSHHFISSHYNILCVNHCCWILNRLKDSTSRIPNAYTKENVVYFFVFHTRPSIWKWYTHPPCSICLSFFTLITLLFACSETPVFPETHRHADQYLSHFFVLCHHHSFNFLSLFLRTSYHEFIISITVATRTKSMLYNTWKRKRDNGTQLEEVFSESGFLPF